MESSLAQKTKYIFYFFIYFVSSIWLSFTFKCRNPTKTIGHYNEKCPITGCFRNFSRYPGTLTIRCVQKRPSFFPIVLMGKYKQHGKKILMPVNITIAHAVADGYHVGLFFQYLQEEINNY